MGQNFDQANRDNTFWPRPNILCPSVHNQFQILTVMHLQKGGRGGGVEKLQTLGYNVACTVIVSFKKYFKLQKCLDPEKRK